MTSNAQDLKAYPGKRSYSRFALGLVEDAYRVIPTNVSVLVVVLVDAAY